MSKAVSEFEIFITRHNGINDKAKLARLATKKFHLTKDRSVYYNQHFAVRFSSANGSGFSNTVLSLSNLRKFDEKPFIVCLVTPTTNYLLLANTTFLKKISHSSQELRIDNIRGSFNGSDINRIFEDIDNCPSNFDRLFHIHASIGFDGNLARLVETSNNISPTGKKFGVTTSIKRTILEAPTRASSFIHSKEFHILRDELDAKVGKFKNEILLASLIENVNVRGRVIEYLIAGKDDRLREELINALLRNEHGLPQFRTDNALGDYSRNFDVFLTETDVKTKLMILNSNPKAYNIDKMLEFLSREKSIFMFYFVGVDPGKIVNTVLVSMFQNKLLSSTILLKHWSGRNSRGVTQLEGHIIKQLILAPESEIEVDGAKKFLEKMINL